LRDRSRSAGYVDGVVAGGGSGIAVVASSAAAAATTATRDGAGEEDKKREHAEHAEPAAAARTNSEKQDAGKRGTAGCGPGKSTAAGACQGAGGNGRGGDSKSSCSCRCAGNVDRASGAEAEGGQIGCAGGAGCENGSESDVACESTTWSDRDSGGVGGSCAGSADGDSAAIGEGEAWLHVGGDGDVDYGCLRDSAGAAGDCHRVSSRRGCCGRGDGERSGLRGGAGDGDRWRYGAGCRTGCIRWGSRYRAGEADSAVESVGRGSGVPAGGRGFKTDAAAVAESKGRRRGVGGDGDADGGCLRDGAGDAGDGDRVGAGGCGCGGGDGEGSVLRRGPGDGDRGRNGAGCRANGPSGNRCHSAGQANRPGKPIRRRNRNRGCVPGGGAGFDIDVAAVGEAETGRGRGGDCDCVRSRCAVVNGGTVGVRRIGCGERVDCNGQRTAGDGDDRAAAGERGRCGGVSSALTCSRCPRPVRAPLRLLPRRRRKCAGISIHIFWFAASIRDLFPSPVWYSERALVRVNHLLRVRPLGSGEP
jgi:hypothetical protein